MFIISIKLLVPKMVLTNSLCCQIENYTNCTTIMVVRFLSKVGWSFLKQSGAKLSTFEFIFLVKVRWGQHSLDNQKGMAAAAQNIIII